MKKIIFFTALVLSILLCSCEKKDPLAPLSGADAFTLTVRSGGGGMRDEDCRELVLSVETEEDGYSAEITAPEQLENVSVSFGPSGTSIRTEFCDIPLSEDAAAGIGAIFEALDILSGRGEGVLPGHGEPVSIGSHGYVLTYGADGGSLFELRGENGTRRFEISMDEKQNK